MKRWLLAATVVLVAACSSSPQSVSQAPSEPEPDGTTPSEAPSEAQSRPAAADTPAALDFTASLIGGGQIDGGDLAGGDVVLWFWAPW